MRAFGMKRCVLTWVCVLAIAFSAGASVSVPSIIGNHMVLQQGKPLPVWGKASPGEAVVVKMGKTEAKTVADAQGRWMVKLPKMKPGGPFDMTIAGKDNTLTLTDILVGEVWIGSGQSNMQMAVNGSAHAQEEIANANFPKIRLFYVERTVATQPQEDCKGRWVACSPQSIPDFSAVLYFFGRELHKTLHLPMGLICTAWGGTPAESWTTRPTLAADQDLKVITERWDKILAEYPKAKEAYDKALAEWKKAAEKAKADNQPEPKEPGAPQGPDSPWMAAGLFNAMIAPLVPYAIQGAIWYQGESNAGRAYQYRKLFPAMIEDWRKVWGEPFSFYFVQLANFTPVLPDPGDSDWAELREAQTMTLALKNTGMATIIDIGDAADIHPKNKQDVGKRLALNALAKDYHKHVVFSGPTYKSMKVKGNQAVIALKDTKGGLVAKGGALKGFAIAGADKKFVWADAKIKGSSVIVSSPKVAAPVSVRYAWAENPDCNLFNGKSLPASPFRTDDWPGITAGKN